MTLLIITGISRGLGHGLLKLILANKAERIVILGLSRTEPVIRDEHIHDFRWIGFDLYAFEEVSTVLQENAKDLEVSKVIFINNAGDINPLNKVGGLPEDGVYNSVKANILSPVNISNWILAKYKDAAIIRMLNITSGAASRPISGWSQYCSAKAYIKMFYDVIQAEAIEDNRNVEVVHINPGVMNTKMQENIRSSGIMSEQNTRLSKMYEKGELKDSDVVAAEIFEQHILAYL